MCSVRIHYALKKYSTVYIRQMINPNYLLGFIGIVAVGKIYEKWRKSTETDEQIKTYQLVKDYLINDSSLLRVPNHCCDPRSSRAERVIGSASIVE